MQFVMIILLAAILIVLLLILFALKFGAAKPADEKIGKRSSLEDQSRERALHLELIMALFAKYEVLTNMIIRRELGYDDRVVVDYMDELERQRKVKQVGRVGHTVHYRKI